MKIITTWLRIDDPDLDVDENSVLVLRTRGRLSAGHAGMGPIADPQRCWPRACATWFAFRRAQRTSHGFCVLHVAPDHRRLLALVRDGDVIELDIPGRRLSMQVSDEELERRRAIWKQPPPRYGRGYGRLFSEHVSQANEGCDFDFLERGAATADPEIHYGWGSLSRSWSRGDLGDSPKFRESKCL